MTWAFDNLDDVFEPTPLAGEHELAEFVARLGGTRAALLDINAAMLNPYGLRALPIVEGGISHDAPHLFDLLRESGSTHGFCIDHGRTATSIRKCRLDRETALIIEREELFAWDRYFVDDQFLAVVAADYSDFSYLCMKPDLFDRFLSRHPIALDLHDMTQNVRSNNFQGALRQAFRRLDAWHKMSSRDMSWAKDPLAWQLDGAGA